MATNGSGTPDALLLLRSAIASNTVPIATSSADASTNTDATDLQQATHLLFNTQSAHNGTQHISLEATAATRFISQRTGAALDLLSVYFSWLNKDTGVGDYISATQALNDQRAQNGLSSITNLVFAEKLDLVNWLAGDESESDFIKTLDDNPETRKEAQDAADMLRGDGDVLMGEAGADGSGAAKGVGREEERMREIYAGERTMGDRNTVLRGIKPTVRALIHGLSA